MLNMQHLTILALALAASAFPTCLAEEVPAPELLAPQDPKPNCNTPSSPVNIFAASYSAGISILQLSGNELRNVSTTTDCGANSVWLQHDRPNSILYSLDESTGAVCSASTKDAAALTKVTLNSDVQYAPVSSIFVGEGDQRVLVLANYGGPDPAQAPDQGPGVSVIAAPADGSKLDILTYSPVDGPGSGVVPERQASPHPHQVLLDPTGKYIIVPDLGTDVLRIYTYAADTKTLAALEPFKVEPGSGPRHGIFWSPAGNLAGYDAEIPLFYILTHEISNTLVVYRVTYPSADKIAFEKTFNTNTFGGAEIPKTALASEVQISPDNKFLYAANRLDGSFTVPNPDASNSTQVPSDSIGVFALKDAGELEFVQLAAIGGVNPRHFSLNKKGDLLAAGLMGSAQVVVLKRDGESGKLGEPLAILNEAADVTTVIWDEE